MSATLLYLDSSAIVKLVSREPETGALFRFLQNWPDRISSVLARVEVLRALRRARVTAAEFGRGQRVLERVGLVRIDAEILTLAASVEPLDLRTLDAIHLATALSLRDELAAIVTYDRRLAEAAASVRISVWAPH